MIRGQRTISQEGSVKMRRELDKQLEILNVELIKMGALCEKVIADTTKALFEGDTSYVSKIHKDEEEIDKCERDIENICMGLFLKQQPVASDLRNISSALKMISDMERIGDQCADIADMIRFTKGHDMNDFQHLNQMSEAAKKMVTESVESYVQKNLEMARAVMEYDDLVDNLFDVVKKDLTNLIAAKPENGEFWIDVIMIAKYFERIADHAVNIAEWVEFSITGEHDK